MDLMHRVGANSPRWSPYSIPMKEDLRPKVNHEPISDLGRALSMYDRGGFALAATRSGSGSGGSRRR